MDHNSPPPGDAPERPAGDTPEQPLGETPLPWQMQQPQQPGQPEQPEQPQQPAPGQSAIYSSPGYNPPRPEDTRQSYPPPAYPQQPGAQPGAPYPGQYPGAYQGQPPYPGQGQQAGTPPPGYQPQGYPPPGYAQPGGTPPGGYPPPGPPQGYPPPGYGAPPRRSGLPGWAWVLIGLVALLIIGCVGIIAVFGAAVSRISSDSNFTTTFSRIGVAIQDSFEPVAAAQEFYSDLESKDFDSAHAILAPDLASRYSAADLESKWQALEGAQGTISPAVLPSGKGTFGTGANRTTASVEADLSSSNGKTYRITVQLEKAGDTWLIKDATPALIPEP
ncbi:MAG: hypothetical protein ACJ78Q_19855 [Chloroflexia bacterium]